MKGVMILTEGRSGSNWLVSLCNATGKLGTGAEWFSRTEIGRPRPKDKETLLEMVLSRSRTENGFFSIKVFPAHVYYIQMKYGFDLIRHFTREHETKFIRLTRNDRLGQAISFAKSLQSGGWTSNAKQSREPEYDFDMISRCYFLLGQSYEFWGSYLAMHQTPHDHFIYEELLGSPMPFLKSVADHAKIEVDKVAQSKHSIQRDSSTDLWRSKFSADLESLNVLNSSALSQKPKRHISNIARLIAGKPLKPYPYMF